MSSNDNLYNVDVTRVREVAAALGGPSVNEGGPSFDITSSSFSISGPSFEMSGLSFKVGGPFDGAFDNSNTAHGDDAHVISNLGDNAPPTWPESKDDGIHYF